MMSYLESQFFLAARTGDAELATECLNGGVDINARDPIFGCTPLHVAAANSARPFLARVVRNPKCDFLAKDRDGLTPSEIAFVHANDPQTGGLLCQMEARQMQKLGIL